MMPRRSSRLAAFGPIPLIFLAASGQIRVGISAAVSTVRPSGLRCFLRRLHQAHPRKHPERTGFIGGGRDDAPTHIVFEPGKALTTIGQRPGAGVRRPPTTTA